MRNVYRATLDCSWWRITANFARLSILCVCAVGGLLLLASCGDDTNGSNNGNGNGMASSIDSDGDLLIDINNLDMLNNIRCSLLGKSYLTVGSDGACATTDGLQCGMNGTTACAGYELMRNLDFADAASYAKNTINNDWRPTDSDGNAVAPAVAVNAGWRPLGYVVDIFRSSLTPAFSTVFEGNGYAISNLYARNAENTDFVRIGLFGVIGSSDSVTIRNLAIINGNVYGGNMRDWIGILAGHLIRASIINCSAQGGSVNGGNGFSKELGDFVGGLVGNSLNESVITASYATASVNGEGDPYDRVGGLVGSNSGTITASYATGSVNGGMGNNDIVGGLIGSNTGVITASYAIGAVDGGSEAADEVGGLAGRSFGTITVSYATGAVDGGSEASDTVGALTAISPSLPPITSYGFGAVSGKETDGIAGSPSPPASAPAIVAATAGCSDGSAKAMSACTGGTLRWVTWGTEVAAAWDFGNAMQSPALKYADYDGTGGIDYCALFRASSGTITCDTTLIPSQPGR